MGRPARDETSCSKDSLFFLMCLLDHILGVVAIVGMPLHFLPYDHGRLAPNETPYPSLTNHVNKLYKHFSLIFFLNFFFL